VRILHEDLHAHLSLRAFCPCCLCMRVYALAICMHSSCCSCGCYLAVGKMNYWVTRLSFLVLDSGLSSIWGGGEF